MRNTRRQLEHDLGTENFDSSVLEAAWIYHRQIGGSHAKGNVPVEVAAFLAGACWAHLLVAEKEVQSRNQ
jgi:hypothetical protein